MSRSVTGYPEIEIEPSIVVGNRNRVPDFRLRRSGEAWLHVEVTAADLSASAERARDAANQLVAALNRLPNGVSVQVRFRREPTREDLLTVEQELSGVTAEEANGAKDLVHAVIHVSRVSSSIAPIGSDEQDRPISGSALARFENGTTTATLAVRIPYTDDRAQQLLDQEARQLPEEGPGLVCICAHGVNNWIPIIEVHFRRPSEGESAASCCSTRCS